MPLFVLLGTVCTKPIIPGFDEWIERIADWKKQGLKSVWFFMHQHDERYSPQLADYLIKKMNKDVGSKIPELHFIDENPDKNLFSK